MRADHVIQSGRKENRLSTARAFPAVLLILLLVVISSFWIDDGCWHWVQTHPVRWLTRWCGKISRYGDWPQLMVPGAIALGAGWFARAPFLFRAVLSMIIASTLAGGVVNSLRLITGRTRPSMTAVTPGWYGLQHAGKSLLHKNKYHSFPSGHTAAAFAFFGILALHFRRWCWFILLPASIIGFARFYIGAHHLSDVLTGCWFGLAFAWLTFIWIEPYLARRLKLIARFQGSSA